MIKKYIICYYNRVLNCLNRQEIEIYEHNEFETEESCLKYIEELIKMYPENNFIIQPIYQKNKSGLL